MMDFLWQPLRELWNRPKGQIPALDALRTMAILSVVFYHSACNYCELAGQENWFLKLPFIRNGWCGVDLFFVLSGYFIGKQLWRELQKTETIHFWRFFLRRGLRIWPLYFFTFAGVAVILGEASLQTGRGWSDLVFLSNYFPHGIVQGGWSLCLEEQFYIIAPLAVLFFAARLPAVSAHRRYLWGLLVTMPIVRLVIWYFAAGDLAHHGMHLWYKYLYEGIHTHCDGLLVGLIISNLEATDGKRFQQGFFGSGLFVITAVVACLALRWLHKECLYFSGLAILFGAMCWYLLSAPRPWLSLLNSWWFYLISRLSFGMYLNHHYFLNVANAWLLKYLPGEEYSPSLHCAAAAILIAACSGCISVVTFCVIEHPFLKLRDRLLRRATSPSALAPVVTLAAEG